MCGIAGVYASREHPDRVREVVGEMVASLHHRGPNDRGFAYFGHFAMGMTRLSIVDVAGGHQPISSEDGTVTVICNGEIYNHEALRRQLLERGHRFATKSDVEVIVHLYEDVGVRCVEQLQGMFGFAIWDQRRQRLVIGRDRLGIKPLYYAQSEGRLLFGSELKALVKSGLLSLSVDEVAIDRFLTFGYIPAPYSIYREVRKLEPGHVLVWENERATIERYWQLQFKPDLHRSEQEFAEEFLRLFSDAIGSHLMGEVPLGAFLSGGLDSSLLVALMSERMHSPVRTFTMGFGGSAGRHFDERPFARLVSDRYKTIHTEYEVQPKVDDVLATAVDAFDEPFADDSVIPSYYICKLAKQDVTVALTGLGGDELFGGYERYVGLKLSQTYERIPSPLRRVIGPVAEALPEPKSGRNRINHLKRFVRSAGEIPARRYLQYITVVGEPLKTSLYAGLPVTVSQNGHGLARFEAGPDATILGQALYNDICTYLPDDILALSDRLSMLQGLELRVPFLDHPLVEFCATIPDKFKIRNLTKKYLLRSVSAAYLPESILTHKKQGFGSPMASWLRHELRGYMADVLSEKNLAQHGLFDAGTVQRLMSEHVNHQESHDRPLFALLMFQKWWDRHY